MADASQRAETIALHLATRGADLWPAIEAAQYARLLLNEPVASEAESQAIADFAEAFADCTERWETTPLPSRTAVLNTLEPRLRSLRDHGLFVHWAFMERGLCLPSGEVRLIPLAVIRVSANRAPCIRAAIADHLDVDDIDDPSE
jgi:hypothetical protein